MDDDWDLHAVVRGCTAAAAAAAAAAATTPTADDQVFNSRNEEFAFTSSSTYQLQDLFNSRSGCCYVEDLHELCKPFLPQSHHTPQKQPQKQQKTQFWRDSSFTSQTPATPRSKRRKNNNKRECVVSAENLPSDMWSWRKYGQKPIKGSPYPRGYYRCSTSKGCTARKQVEKNRSDPGMLIVTYTGEHNHPMPAPNLNLTAGDGTRHKQTEVSKSKEQSFSTELSPAVHYTPERESPEDFVDDDDDEFGVSKIGLDDKFFTGLEE